MTSNPHPEHGPLWVERNVDSTAQPHRLRLPVDEDGDEYCYVTTAQADAIEAQFLQLPDGVYRKGGELWVAEGFPLDSAAWQFHFPYGGEPWRTPTGQSPVSIAGPTLVRRTPAEPPAPPTEDVPWWEALRDERLLPGDLGTRCISTGFVGGRRWVGEGDAVGSYLNPDGTVTVQAQGVES